MNNPSNMINRPPVLPDGVSLRLFSSAGDRLFESAGKWLYPLFEVEDYLHAEDIPADDIFLNDRIAGRAAASLIVWMGFRRCFIETISSHALDVFNKAGVDCGYLTLVPKIDCRTEDLISGDMEISDVYRMLRTRAGRLQGIDLEISGLHAGYDGKTVLSGLDLRLEAGEQLVVTGDNGAGKSTLLKCLTGVVTPSAGEILLGGRPSKSSIPSPIGYVNQSINTADFPVLASEVVALGLMGQKLSAADRSYQIEIAMRRTGCYRLAGRNIHKLSGGEKQRVSLARCLAQKAGLILMDEPTSFLDQESKEDFLDLLNNIVRRTMPTIILVSHDHQWLRRLGWNTAELRGGRLCSSL